MASAKKRRGRERKAARKKDNNNGDGRTSSTNGGVVVGGGIDVDSNAWVVIVGGIRSGYGFSTSKVIGLYGSRVHSRQHLIRAGLLDVILGYLARCNENFDSVMRDIGGDLVSPYLWVELLVTIATKSSEYHSQIIDSIGPLVSCMCDDVERKFFGSKQYWHEAVLPFIAIVHKLLELECNFIQLSQYKGYVFEMIIQSWFWESNRCDIVNEFNNFISTSDIPITTTWDYLERNDIASDMTVLGGSVTFSLLEWARQNDDARNMLGGIGSVPIVSKAYDPNCKVSFVGGIIRQLKINLKKSGDRKKYFHALFLLVHHADCVDKDVMVEMIDLGTNFTSEYKDVNVITRLVCSMITRKMDNGNAQPNDTRTAFATRAGLLDMCMDMIARFGGIKNARGILISVSSILRNIYLLSFHKKTSKAIGAKRGHLVEKFERLKENQQVTNNGSNECKQVLCLIQSIIDITSTTCFVCNKETERKDMKKCAACESVCYCSEECQRKDWQSTHQQDCEVIIDGYHQKLLPELRGNNEHETVKLKSLERNIMMAQKGLFLRHAEAIRLQLAAKQSPQSEYIVHFSLHQCPLEVIVLSYTEYFVHEDHQRKWFEESMLPDDTDIMCVYESPFFNGYSDELGLTEKLIVYNLFPREWLLSEA